MSLSKRGPKWKRFLRAFIPFKEYRLKRAMKKSDIKFAELKKQVDALEVIEREYQKKKGGD